MNPPDVSGKCPLERKRLWYFTSAKKDQLLLATTIELFKSYFGTSNYLELSYFDGEEGMLILKNEDLKEACSYFVQCYRDFDNYQDYLKIYVNEKLKPQVSPTVTVKLPEGTSTQAKSLYNLLTTEPRSNVAASKLDKMKIKLNKEFNVKEIQGEVLDKSGIKCIGCKKVVKLGKPYNIHNFRKHFKRCQKIDSRAGTQSIASLFLAMAAISQQVKSKAEKMIAECHILKDNGEAVEELMESLLQVVKKPSSLDAVAGEIKRQTLEAVKSKDHPLYKHFTALCVAGKVDDENSSEETTTTSSSDEESDDSTDASNASIYD